MDLSATYLPEKQSKYRIILDIELRGFLRNPNNIKGESEKGYRNAKMVSGTINHVITLALFLAREKLQV